MKNSTAFAIIAAVCLWTGIAAASSLSPNMIDAHIRGAEKSRSRRVAPVLPSTLEAGTFQQDIDHFARLPGKKFAQRYWVESSYATSPEAPILFHICGEGDATQAYFLNDNAIAWAKTLGARIVYLEHRYYGTSQPFADLSTEHMQYLTLDNVIEDLAVFQKWIASQRGWNGKWISVGGSYSGTLSAIYRQKHPELVAGALASSAPMISGVGEQTGSSGDVDELSDLNPADHDGERQWAFQACRDFGFWEAMGGSYNSALLLPSPWLCGQAFGDTPQTNYDDYNKKYDLPYLANSPAAPSRILFTYGSEDVWTRIGLVQQTNENPGIVIHVIQGAGHHFDLNPPDATDSPEVTEARALFVTLIKQWMDNDASALRIE